MGNFISKYRTRLKTTALALMLLIPFLLYTAAVHGAFLQLKLYLTLMIGTMLFVMTKG